MFAANKIFMAILLALAGLGTSHAQGLSFGVQTGANVSHLVYDVKSDAKLGAYLGAFADYRLGYTPWSVRLGVNWENNNTRLKNLDLNHPTGQILRYDITLHHLSVPLSIGYTLGANCLNGVELTPRVGFFYRRGITSSGSLTSYLLSAGGSDKPGTVSIAPFEGGSGEVPKSQYNPLGTYHYSAYSKATYGLFAGLDVSINKHWQINTAYKFGTGHSLTHSQKERGYIWLNSFELGASYIF